MKFLKVKNSVWVYTGKNCKRCGENIYVERLDSGTFLLDNLCCERGGCTWPDYRYIELELEGFGKIRHKQSKLDIS